MFKLGDPGPPADQESVILDSYETGTTLPRSLATQATSHPNIDTSGCFLRPYFLKAVIQQLHNWAGFQIYFSE